MSKMMKITNNSYIFSILASTSTESQIIDSFYKEFICIVYKYTHFTQLNKNSVRIGFIKKGDTSTKSFQNIQQLDEISFNLFDKDEINVLITTEL